MLLNNRAAPGGAALAIDFTLPPDMGQLFVS